MSRLVLIMAVVMDLDCDLVVSKDACKHLQLLLRFMQAFS